LPKLKIFGLLMSGLLGVSVLITAANSCLSPRAETEVQREELLVTDQEWVLQFDITNRESEDKVYLIRIEFQDRLSEERILVSSGKTYKYTHHIARTPESTGNLEIEIFKQGENDPLETTTYYLPGKGSAKSPGEQ
jgi:hypothetical protein